MMMNNTQYPGGNQTNDSPSFTVWLLGSMTAGPDLLLNMRRGARTAPVSMLVISLPLLLVLAGVSAYFEPGYGEEMIALVLLTFVAAVFRHWESWDYLRAGTKPLRHTYHLGENVLKVFVPLLPRWAIVFGGDHWSTQRVFNPMVCILLGSLVYWSGDSYVVAGYLVIGGLLMGFKNQLMYEQLIQHVLNLYDGALMQYVLPRLLDDQGNEAEKEVSVPITSGLAKIIAKMPRPEGSDRDGDAPISRSIPVKDEAVSHD